MLRSEERSGAVTIAIDTPRAAAMQQEALCAHCNLPVPIGLVRESAERQFCCHGCETVFTLIHSCRLDRYYRYRDADGGATEPAKTTGKGYREFDYPTFLELHAPRVST